MPKILIETSKTTWAAIMIGRCRYVSAWFYEVLYIFRSIDSSRSR
jgi:hypothetical protein